MKIKELLKCPDKEKANNQIKLVGELPIQTGPLASAECSLFSSNSLQNSIQGTNACKKFYPEDMVRYSNGIIFYTVHNNLFQNYLINDNVCINNNSSIFTVIK